MFIKANFIFTTQKIDISVLRILLCGCIYFYLNLHWDRKSQNLRMLIQKPLSKYWFISPRVIIRFKISFLHSLIHNIRIQNIALRSNFLNVDFDRFIRFEVSWIENHIFNAWFVYMSMSVHLCVCMSADLWTKFLVRTF